MCIFTVLFNPLLRALRITSSKKGAVLPCGCDYSFRSDYCCELSASTRTGTALLLLLQDSVCFLPPDSHQPP